MLKLGLLEGITKFIISFYSDNTSPDLSTTLLLKNIVGNMLPNNLFHYPVVAAAIKSTDGLIHSRAIRVLELGVIRDEWSFFFNMLLERAAAKALYDLKLKNENHRTCHNVNQVISLVSIKTLTFSFVSAVYQRRTPDRKLWLVLDVDAHSTALETARRRAGQRRIMRSSAMSSRSYPGVRHESPSTICCAKYATDIYFSFHSNFFLPKLIAFDLRRHLPGIKKLLASSPEFRNVKGSDVGYAISYVNVKQEPILEISLFCASSVTDASTLKSGERPKAGVAKIRSRTSAIAPFRPS